MSDQSPQEPTMEEILASIRRIISEDDAPAEAAAAPEPEPAPVEEAPAEDDVLELTDPIEPPAPVESMGDIDVYSPEPEPEPAPPPPPPPEPAPASAFSRDEVADNLVGDHAAGLAASAFGSLSSALLMPKDGRTLEDVVRELLRPLLKEWLDQNLPRIVEAKVEEEVHRIARGRGV
ncbi:pole-organizing protein PopZ [Caulobacter sp. LjRoot300]|jgi:cell pole-organizing protein PopZ|uniref:pole-organizing protein PopZ n=1 Tax=Caulobacter sp. LjRoot300 TaxID=3342321 RepID=UPI003ECE88C6